MTYWRFFTKSRPISAGSGVRNAARILDLDLLIYHGKRDLVGPPILPHPRMFERDFVMVPLATIADAEALRAEFDA